MSATAIGEWVLSGGLLVGIGYTCVRSLASEGRRGRLRLLALRRAPRARRAAEEAALDDPAFAPEHIEAAVREMLPRVLRRFGDLSGGPRVDILGVVNRAGEAEDRVVVRVRARVVRDPPEPAPRQVFRIDERWTLVHEGMRWRLAADMGDPLAASLLSSPLVAAPEDDASRLHEASLEELTEPRPHGGTAPGELTDPSAPAPERLRDLAVADDRFDPLLIEAAIRHIVEAWEESGDGGDAPLLAVATGAGLHALSFPEPNTGRRRIHDAHLRRWEVTRLDTDATPPQLDVRVRVMASVSSDTELILAGDVLPTERLDLVWTLELDETTHAHLRWRLIDSTSVS